MTINHGRVTYTLTQLYAEQGYCDEAEVCLSVLEKHNHDPDKTAAIRQILKEQKEIQLKSLMTEWIACIRQEASE